MKNSKIQALALLPLLVVAGAHADTVSTFKGQTPRGAECSLTIQVSDVDPSRVTGFNVEGEAKQWEIIAENNNGYGPQTSYVHYSADSSTGMDFMNAEVFKHFNMTQGRNLFGLGSGTLLKGKVKAEVFEMLVSFEIKGPLAAPTAFKFASRAKTLAVVSLATQELVCNNLRAE